MASSFIVQVPSVIQLIQKLEPKVILDIGKGFGKYGFLIHEYIGIKKEQRINPSSTLRDLSSINIDSIEVDADLMLPHLDHLYRKVFFGDVLKLYPTLQEYDLVLMVDIIEHIPKEPTLQMLKHFLNQGSRIIIATPINFFEQKLYESEFENHVSHWTLKDFKKLGFVDVQYFDAGAVYLLSSKRINIRGFGSGILKKIRRVARLIKNEMQGI